MASVIYCQNTEEPNTVLIGPYLVCGMRSTLALCGGGGKGRGLRAKVGRMKRFLCVRPRHRVDVQTDIEPGVWLRSYQLLDTEGQTEDPVQEWGEEVEDGAVFGITLHREPVQHPSDPSDPESVAAFSFIQYHTVKVRRLKAGTLERLITHLLNADQQEAGYTPVFLSTYRTFTCTNTLIELLFQREDVIANLDNTVCPMSSLLPVIRLWLTEYKEDLRDPPYYHSLKLLCGHLRHRLCFRRLAVKAEVLFKKFQEEDFPTRQSSSEEKIHSQQQLQNEEQEGEEGSTESATKEEETQDVMDFPAKEVAEQLTQLDAELFLKVVPFQCVGCVWSQRDKKENHAPTVRATIAQFNAVTNRVITSLLCPSMATYSTSSPTSSPSVFFSASSSPRCLHTSPAHRARVIERWIEIAQECRQLKNFSSLRAILSALQSNAVYRLKKTWAAVSKEYIASFDLLCETFPDENCVLTSREILVEDDSQPEDNVVSESPKLCPMSGQMSSTSGIIPYLGTYLTVLTMLDTALTDIVEGGLINFEKRRREFEILSQIQQLQTSCRQYNLLVNQRICTWLQASTLLTDQISYELSRELEPPVDPCPNSPSSWGHRLITKKLTSLLSAGESSNRKTHSDQISVSSSGSSGSEMEDMSSPQPLHLKLKSLPSSLHNMAEGFSASSLSSSSSPTPSASSSCSPPPDPYGSSFTNLDSPPSSSSCCSSSSPQASLPVYNKQVADSCIVRVSVECGNNGNVYKSILLTSQDHTRQVIQRALEKHNIEGVSSHDFSLSQVLSQDKELQIPEKANVFYAMSTSANYDFVLRQRWKSHSKHFGPSSSPGAVARGRHAK